MLDRVDAELPLCEIHLLGGRGDRRSEHNPSKEYSRVRPSRADIALAYFPHDSFRAVDIERGLFKLIEEKRHGEAAEILNRA